MRRICFLVFFLFSIQFVNSQNFISGNVINKKGQPIVGATIAIKDSYDGAVSDSSGAFKFLHNVEAKDTIIFTAIGYKTYEMQLTTAEMNTTLKIILVEDITEMEAVIVRSAGSFMAGSNKKGVMLSALDIVTTAQNGDVTSALRSLPGAQQVGEQEGLFVRGGTAQETKQYIDGAIVPNPYFKGAENYAQRGRYNPFLFSGTTFSTGGYSALYGDALSSVVLLNTVDLPERPDVGFTISPISLEASTQQIAKNKQASWGVHYGLSFISPYFNILKPRIELFNGPTYHVADANFRIKTKGGIVKFFTSFNNNHSGIREANIDSNYLKNQTLVKNDNLYYNLSWQEQLGLWRLNWSNSLSYNKDNINGEIVNNLNQPERFSANEFWMNSKIFAVLNKETVFQTRVVLERKLKQLDAIRFGAEYNYLNNNLTYRATPSRLRENAQALFAEMDKYFSNKLAVVLGARAEYSSIINKINLAPRASIVYKVGKAQQATFAYGLFYQKPENSQLIINNNLDYLRAHHYLLNYIKSSSKQLFRIEAYYKTYENLIKTTLANGQQGYNNSGSGYARGIDVFWKDKKSIPLFEYWISYSYLDTKRNFANYTDLLRPSFATPHTASLVIKKFFLPIKTQINLTYSFATGRPYYYFQPHANGYTLKDQGKTITYNNLGLSFNYVPFVGNEHKKARLIWVATISNLLNSKQIYGYNYAYSGLTKQPILPATRQFFFLGLFINIGTDRTQQIINDNL